MLLLAGIVIVFAAVVGGFLMEGGPLHELAQPAELVIILGAAAGAAMVGNTSAHLRQTGRAIARLFRRSVYTKELYLQTLAMLANLFHFARRAGARAVESEVEEPSQSALFAEIPRSDVAPEVVEFVCDTLRMTVLAQISPFALDEMMEQDLENRRLEDAEPGQVLNRLSDALPGFGIIAAVLGVILSMGSLRETPERMGMKIASALVGTFLGILLAYGVVSPLAELLTKRGYEETAYFASIRAALSAFAKGMPVAIAVECARRAIPENVRPGFDEADQRCHPHPQPVLAAKA